MEKISKIYGTLFIGAISVALFYSAVLIWNDNVIFSLLLGFFGVIMLLYAIGLFLLPLVTDLLKK